jgi:biotin operon repressor
MSGQPVEAEEIRVIIQALGALPLTKGDLQLLTGISPRHVERVISHIRREGIALIASGTDGYWLPATLAEAAADIERLRVRALHQLLTVRGQRRLLRRMEAAESLTLWRTA